MPDSASYNPTLATGAMPAARLREALPLLAGFPLTGCRALVHAVGEAPVALNLEIDTTSRDGATLHASASGVSLTSHYTASGVCDVLDEAVAVHFSASNVSLQALHYGLEFSLERLASFRLHPLPFKIGLDGLSKTVNLTGKTEVDDYAEGWILENGQHGLLVMRLPVAGSRACFVPVRTHGDGLEPTLQFGSFGPDVRPGDEVAEHKTRSFYLIEPLADGALELPATRFAAYEGGWEEGVELFKRFVAERLPRLSSYRSSPVTYNTYHDFGPSYSRRDILEALPRLQALGFGMLHLDPGWETAWGSAGWDSANMGSAVDLIKQAAAHGMKVGLWTSMHTRDGEEFGDLHTLDAHGRKYLAEEFGPVKLWGVCPISAWQNLFRSRMRPLMEAGVCFVNSDFHDWPWSGESCHSQSHNHAHPPTRLDWVEALNNALCSLRQFNPDLTVEMHDHVECGEYRTPVWYLYGQEGSYDEKWAYEFMWTTYDDLLSGKLYALYHLRKAEPVPLYLHMNMMSDNQSALAFWYVASCVNHIGVGGALKAPPEIVEAYTTALSLYNAHAEEMTQGEFIGLDELAHLHVHPDRSRAFLLAFNLEDRPVTRMIRWRYGRSCPDLARKRVLVNGQEPSLDAGLEDVALFAIQIPALGVAFACLEFH